MAGVSLGPTASPSPALPPQEAANAAAHTTASPVVQVSGLTIRFGAMDAPAAVDGISLSINAGETLALVGESGSGKSVTARALVSLLGGGATVTADVLRVAGLDIPKLGRRQLEKLRGATVGTITQDALSSLDPLRLVGREVDDALRLHTSLSALQRRTRVLELLAEAGIPDPRVRAAQRSGELSGGLRQRALIAAALAANPKLLVADEPTTALDAQVRNGILDLIKRQADTGMAVLLISHDLGAVARVADRVAVMTDGRIVEEGPTARVLEAPAHEYTRRLLAASPAGKPRHQALLAGITAGTPTSGTASAVPRPPASTHPRPQSVSATGSPSTPPALQARGIAVSFTSRGEAPRTVLSGLDFNLPEGTTLGLVGPSGSGKTTLARIALGLQKPDAGELLLLGEKWSSLPETQRRPRRGLIGAIYQDPMASFDPRFTVAQLLTDSITHGASTRSSAVRPRVRELLDSVGLESTLAARRPRTLSGGQRQRVAIARALGAEPRVLVLDEPVSALDVTIQAQVLDLLDSLQRDLTLSYLFISHDSDVIEHMSDTVLRLD